MLGTQDLVIGGEPPGLAPSALIAFRFAFLGFALRWTQR
jgi:hypothetical protein